MITKSVVYKCSAEHYKGDRPHFWTVVEGHERFHHQEKGKRVILGDGYEQPHLAGQGEKTMSTLQKGERYEPESLLLAGWTEGDGSGTEGYNLYDYFAAGIYLGPDQHGIEPLVTA